MKFKAVWNIILGITTEFLYVFSIMLTALLICSAVFIFKR